MLCIPTQYRIHHCLQDFMLISKMAVKRCFTDSDSIRKL